MKKLFFTAVALVAFSSISVANTIEPQSSILLDSSQNTEKAFTHCEEFAMLALEEMDPDNELDNVTAHDIFHGLNDACEKISSWIF